MAENELLPKAWNLKESGLVAFSADAAREDELDLYVVLPSLEQKWTALLDRASRAGTGNFMHFIVGSYGRGKSLSLFRIEQIIHKEYPNLIIPIRLDFMNEESVTPRNFLCRILVKIAQTWLIDSQNLNPALDSILGLPQEYSEWRGVLGAIMLPPSIQRTSHGETLFGEEPNDAGPKLDLKRAAVRYLSGLSLTPAEHKGLQVEHRLDNIETAWSIIAALRIVLYDMGYHGVVLLVDEFEYLFSHVSKTRRPSYVALLRRMYDAGSPDGLSGHAMTSLNFFLGVSEGGMSEFTEMGKHEYSSAGPTGALVSRIGSTVLTNFTLDQTRELIKKRLQRGRSDLSAAAQKKYYIIPFDEDFVAYVQDITMGLPREIVRTCRDVLEAGIATGISLLTREFAEKVASDRA